MKKNLISAVAGLFLGSTFGLADTNGPQVKIRGIVNNYANLEFVAPASTTTNGYRFLRSTNALGNYIEGKNYSGEIKIGPTNRETIVQGFEPMSDGGTNYFFFGLKKLEYDNGNENEN